MLEMAQLWVNLPAKHKMTAPGYQAILTRDIPALTLPKDAGILRIIAGEHDGHKGPARTHTPMNVWDLRLNQGGNCQLTVPDGWHTALIVLRGAVTVNGGTLGEAQTVVFASAGSDLSLEASSDTVALLLSGEPINEPIVGQGPFVMNSQEEIDKTITDFNRGRFGQMPQ